MHRMAHPPGTVVKPAPRQPPPELVSDYTQNGACPIENFLRYRDQSNETSPIVVDNKQFIDLLQLEKTSNVNPFGDTFVQPVLAKYAKAITGKQILVIDIGSTHPWAESMFVNRGAKLVVSATLHSSTINHPAVKSMSLPQLAEQVIENNRTVGGQPFDVAFSNSVVEHAGLGRYGDALAPFGDLEVTAQVWCMLKPGGYFFLALFVSTDRKGCFYEWNAHRVFGEARLQHLTANWEVVEEYGLGVGSNTFYVLKKV